MSALSFKMLFRKRETASSILAIALLIAILASMNSVINYINYQAEALGGFVNVGGTFLIMSRNSTSITDSQVNVGLASLVSGITDVEYTLPQRILKATLITNSGNHTILLRGVEDLSTFLKLRRAHVNGTIAKSKAEANLGEILARSASIDMGEEVKLTVGNKASKVKVVGIVRTLTQTDAELIVPMETTNCLTEDNDKLSFIEFAVKENSNEKEVISQVTQLLPTDVTVVKAQQPKEFMQKINSQTLAFLNLWSVAVYAVVVATSYVIATRFTAESSYELALLKAFGAKKELLFTLVLTYSATTALAGFILGISLGIVGAQTASSIFMWTWPGLEINPIVEPVQALQTLLLTLAASTIGCIIPATKSIH